MNTRFIYTFTLILALAGIYTIAASKTNTLPVTKIPVLHSHSFGGSKIRYLHYTKGYEKLVSFFYQQTDIVQPENYLFDRDIHKIISFNYKDVQVDMGIYGSIPNVMTTQLGQEDDINTLYANLEKITEPELIGFGVSRGAATWITMLGSKMITKKIAVLILESPFASMKNVSMYNLLRYCVECAHTVVPSFDSKQTTDLLFNILFKNHNVSGIQPIDVVALINKDIPIMLVHSHQDATIPINHSRELYIKFKESGQKQVYLVEMDEGAHAAVLWGPQGELYRNIVHALYRDYNLPHNPTFAGSINLSSYQPSVAAVQKRIDRSLPEASHPKKEADKGSCYSSTFNFFM